MVIRMSSPRISASHSRTRYLILPGWNGSPAAHWQSHWQAVLPDARRVEQADWACPQRADWVAALEREVQAASGPLILIAHSLGCITLAHWAATAAAQQLAKIAGVLLVAPADVERRDCPPALQNFAPIPRQRLPFPALLIGSDNDHAASASRARAMAADWGAAVEMLAGAGHINVASGHQQWEDGLQYLQRLEPVQPLPAGRLHRRTPVPGGQHAAA